MPPSVMRPPVVAHRVTAVTEDTRVTERAYEEGTVRERLREVDANLLLSLHALLEERNLTHAGERMTMSQPAMSGALARLRKHFDDELLVRVGRGLRADPARPSGCGPRSTRGDRGRRGAARQPARLRPGLEHQAVRVSMSEYAMTVLAEPLTRLLGRAGAGLLGVDRRASTSRRTSSRPS